MNINVKHKNIGYRLLIFFISGAPYDALLPQGKSKLANGFVIFFLGCFSLFYGISGYAASLGVYPLSISLMADHPIASLHLTNSSEKPLLLQLKLFKWTQKPEGGSVYAQQHDLLVTPPIITIGAKQAQIVRLGLRHPLSEKTEQAYRLYLQEVATDQSNAKGTHFSFLLRVGVPVFTLPKTNVQPKLHWQGHIIKQNKQRMLKLQVQNEGTAHARLTELALSDADSAKPEPVVTKQSLAYVLAGHHQQWVLPLPSQWKRKQRIKVVATLDKRKQIVTNVVLD